MVKLKRYVLLKKKSLDRITSEAENKVKRMAVEVDYVIDQYNKGERKIAVANGRFYVVFSDDIDEEGYNREENTIYLNNEKNEKELKRKLFIVIKTIGDIYFAELFQVNSKDKKLIEGMKSLNSAYSDLCKVIYFSNINIADIFCNNLDTKNIRGCFHLPIDLYFEEMDVKKLLTFYNDLKQRAIYTDLNFDSYKKAIELYEKNIEKINMSDKRQYFTNKINTAYNFVIRRIVELYFIVQEIQPQLNETIFGTISPFFNEYLLLDGYIT